MKAIISDVGGRVPMRKKPTPTSRSHSCAAAPRSPCAAGESLHSPTLTLPGAFQNPLGIGPPSAEEIPSMSPASSRYQRSRSSQTLQDHPEDDPPQGAQPDPETLSDSSLACEILSQQPRNKTWGASKRAPARFWDMGESFSLRFKQDKQSQRPWFALA